MDRATGGGRNGFSVDGTVPGVTRSLRPTPELIAACYLVARMDRRRVLAGSAAVATVVLAGCGNPGGGDDGGDDGDAYELDDPERSRHRDDPT